MDTLSGKVAAISGGTGCIGGPAPSVAVHAGCGKAFESSLVGLVCLLGLMAAMPRLLPGRHCVELESLKPTMAAKERDQQ